jgi:Rrf2 family protein
MKFSQKSEYGVRLLVELARHSGQGPLSLAEIARNEELSQTFLEQVIMPLRKAGFVRSHQGVRGGYELARAPEDISMGPVMRVLENSLAPMFCVTDTPDRDVCAFEDHCGTRVLWARVRDGINAALDATTLADLLDEPTDGHQLSAVGYQPLQVMAPGACGDYRPAT